MSNLKKSLVKKMDISPSNNFDAEFFKKLEHTKGQPKLFSKWTTWIISGLATTSVLVFAITNYHVSPKHAFNHQEYVDSVLEMQSSFDESIIDDNTIDLTTLPSDEI